MDGLVIDALPTTLPARPDDSESSPVHAARIDAPADVDGFRREARSLLARGVPPAAVTWCVHDDAEAGLFDAAPTSSTSPTPVDGVRATAPSPSPSFKVPPAFVALTEAVALHSEPQRHALLYELLWRLQHEPALRSDPLDPQWLRAEHMAQAVRRDMHKMKAFVRFRTLARGTAEPPLHVAWFEPEHHIVEAVAPFFVRRFTQMHWSLLTPKRSASWDGERLTFGPAAAREQAPPADAGEALWLTYYRHIFNPARLKMAMMQKEMPRRYWKNLPEAVLIQPLAAAAHERSSAMVDKGPTEPTERSRLRSCAAQAARLGGAPSRPIDVSFSAPEPARRLPGSAPRLLPPIVAAPAGGAEETEATAMNAQPTLNFEGDLPAAARIADLSATRDAALGCTQCPLYAGATQTVFGEGPVDAALMFVGEQPGDQEDLRGRPFVGPAGQMFVRAMAELNVDRASVYVTNAVKHFKYELRGKRRIHKSPAQREAAACLDWLEREIALVKPKAVVALGATAARSLLGRAVAVLRERGQWIRRADGVPVLVTLHPSALLRMPPEEQADAYRAWLADLRVAMAGPG